MILLIQWLVLVVIVCLLYWVVSQFAPPQILKVVMVVCVVICVLSLIWLLLGFFHLALPR
jgi:hypothetical protein